MLFHSLYLYLVCDENQVSRKDFVINIVVTIASLFCLTLFEQDYITPEKYNTFNSLFFLPNVVTPLLAGVLAERLGGASRCLVGALVVYSLGHCLFAAGVTWAVDAAMYLGRVISGMMYEVIDTLPIAFLHPILKERWGLATGALNTFLRLGSVLTFIVCPAVYHATGSVAGPIWVSVGMTMLGIVAASVCELLHVAVTRSSRKLLCRH